MADQYLPNYANNILGAFQQGQDRGKQSKLAQLLGTAVNDPSQRQSALGQAAMIDPGAAMSARHNINDESLADLSREAGLFLSMAQSGDQQSIAPAYAQLAQKAAVVFGHPLPTNYDPKYLPMIEKLASSGGGGQGASGVQSTYLDDKGQRVAVMRDGSVQVLGANAPNNQIIDTGNGFVGVNKGNLQAAPVMMGGASPQQAPQAAPGEVPFTIDPSLPPDVQASIRSNPQAGSAAGISALPQVPQGQQLRSTPKPPAPPSQIDMARLNLAQQASARDAERLRLQQQAASRTATGKPADTVKAEKLAAARADALDSVTQAISGIDSLTKGGGFDNLGTFKGDLLSHVYHSQTKDAANALETVKNQVLLTTLGKLKALSATGASGFGALSNQEGNILKNSIANLDTAQSQEAILKNLKIIRGTLQRAAGLIGGNGTQASQAGHVDDLLSKYGVK